MGLGIWDLGVILPIVVTIVCSSRTWGLCLVVTVTATPLFLSQLDAIDPAKSHCLTTTPPNPTDPTNPTDLTDPTDPTDPT